MTKIDVKTYSHTVTVSAWVDNEQNRKCTALMAKTLEASVVQAQSAMGDMLQDGLFGASRLPKDLWCPSCDGKGYLNPNGADETAKANTPCTTCERTGRAPIPFSELWGRNVAK